jgi:hypothetical protein
MTDKRIALIAEVIRKEIVDNHCQGYAIYPLAEKIVLALDSRDMCNCRNLTFWDMYGTLDGGYRCARCKKAIENNQIEYILNNEV